MINYTELSTKMYSCYKIDINQMEKMVFELLHRYHGEIVPQQCIADWMLTPGTRYHSEYFRSCKKAAERIFDKWEQTLIACTANQADLDALNKIRNGIYNAKDSIELTWAGMELRKSISPYIDNGKFIPPNLAT